MGADTLSGAIQNVLWFFGDVAFTWVPATVVSVSGTVASSTTSGMPITQPLTASDVLTYVQQNSTSQAYASFLNHWIVFTVFSIIISFGLVVFVIYCALHIL